MSLASDLAPDLLFNSIDGWWGGGALGRNLSITFDVTPHSATRRARGEAINTTMSWNWGVKNIQRDTWVYLMRLNDTGKPLSG